MQSDIGKALFLTLKKALEQGMIGDNKDFSRKVCVKWKDTEFERQVSSIVIRGSGSLFTYFFPFLRVNFSRENKFRLRMFVRCGVFFPVDRGCLFGVGYFLRSRMFVRCGVFF